MDIHNDLIRQHMIRSACRAIDIAGGATAMSRALVSQEGRALARISVQTWKRKGVGPYWVLAVERLTGVSRHDLHPILYPMERPILPPEVESQVAV